MKKVKPEFRLVGIDETIHWREDIQAAAGRIINVYLFDTTSQHYLCSLTPAAELIPVGVVTKELSDDMWNEVRMALNEDGCYWDYNPALRLPHWQGVELEVTDEEWAEYLEDSEGDTDLVYDMIIEELKDYLSGNSSCYELQILQAMGVQYE